MEPGPSLACFKPVKAGLPDHRANLRHLKRKSEIAERKTGSWGKVVTLVVGDWINFINDRL